MWVVAQDTADDYESIVEEVADPTERLADFTLNTAPVLSFDGEPVQQENSVPGVQETVFHLPSAIFWPAREALGSRA